MGMPLTPTIVANPRQDLLVSAGDFTDSRQTTYSGRLLFGQPASRGTMVSRMDFAGLVALPDSFTYRDEQLGTALVSADFWIQSMSEYLFVPSTEARFLPDPRQPGTSWLHLGLTVEGYSGAILGYRVVATVNRQAVVGT